MTWISVNKRLPRSKRTVLVFSPESIGTKGHLIGTYWNKKDGGYAHWTVMDGDFQERRIVTHWMPLPPKP